MHPAVRVLPLVIFAFLPRGTASRADESAAEVAPKAKPSNLVTKLAGLKLGEDDLESVRKKYGPGLFVEDEGHTGGLYYLNKKRTLALHVVLGEGYRIEQIELLPVDRLPSAVDRAAKTLISRALAEPFDNDHGLTMGMTPGQVRQAVGELGEGSEVDGMFTLSYEADNEADERVGAYYTMTFEFIDNRLVSISIYDGC